MVKWEYKVSNIIEGVSRSGLEAGLNDVYGLEGWELIAIHKRLAIFKRPIEPSLREQFEEMRMCCERRE